MYLRGLSGPYDAFPPNVIADAERCEKAGGYPSFVYAAYDANRVGIPATASVNCKMPAAAPKVKAAKPTKSVVRVNVPTTTTVNTQINPVISPTFVQQDEPVNSPVTPTHTVATPPITSSTINTGTGSGTPSVTDTTMADLLTLLAARQPASTVQETYQPGGTAVPVASSGDAVQQYASPLIIGIAAAIGLFMLSRK